MPAADLQRWLTHAQEVARAAGAVLLEHQAQLQSLPTEFKGRPTELVTAADRAAEQAVVSQLLQNYPEHAVLAEEGVLTPQGKAHQDSDWLWVVDPLDGTTNFVHGLPFYCVSMALTYQGEVVLGVVYAPVLDWMFSAVRGGGAQRNGQPMLVTKTTQTEAALLATGFSYNRNEAGSDNNMQRLTRALHASRDVRRHGSAALDLCMTAAGHFDGYWELYLMPYDVAAGALIVQEAGGKVTDLRGGDDWLYGGEILASNDLLHQQLLQVVGGAKSV